MDFDKYCKMVQCKVSMYLGSEYEVTLRKVTKNNGVMLTGIMARLPESNICPTLYLEDYYNNELTPDDIEYIGLEIANGLKSVPPEEYPDVSSFEDFGTARERIVYKLINAEENKGLLLDMPYRRFHNLAIVYFYYEEDILRGGSNSILIKNEHAKMWDTDEETLYRIACHNTPMLLPAYLRPISEVVSELFKHEIECEVNMYVLSNEAKIYGAGAILYDDILNEAYEAIGADYYIIPSSVHELILLPDNEESKDSNAKMLLDMVIRTNHTQVEPRERLADSVYYYNHETGLVEWLC